MKYKIRYRVVSWFLSLICMLAILGYLLSLTLWNTNWELKCWEFCIKRGWLSLEEEK